MNGDLVAFRRSVVDGLFAATERPLHRCDRLSKLPNNSRTLDRSKGRLTYCVIVHQTGSIPLFIVMWALDPAAAAMDQEIAGVVGGKTALESRARLDRVHGTSICRQFCPTATMVYGRLLLWRYHLEQWQLSWCLSDRKWSRAVWAPYAVHPFLK